MKILFIGIFDNNEPNTAFRNAFKKVSSSYNEIAWNLYPKKEELNLIIARTVKEMQPELIFMQLQGPGIINDYALDVMRRTGAFLCQWTGDARQPLPKHYIEFGRKIDLSLFTNMDDVRVMRKYGVKADYLQVSADHTIYTPEGPKVECPEIVFMGNNYGDTFGKSKYRKQMVEFLQNTYEKRFGVYGSGWDNPAGNLMFQQKKEAEVYRSCKIAINCSHYDLVKYTSDRFFRILLSGAFCLSKDFPGMSDFNESTNFVSFYSFEELKVAIDTYLKYESPRKVIAKYGCTYAHEHWTWDHRIKELLILVNTYKNELDKRIA